jgi:hypothetical protein
MAKEKYSLLVDFIEDFEREIEMKSKIISSEKNQLIKITRCFQESLTVDIKPTRVTEGDHPVAYIKFKKKLSDRTMSEIIENFLAELGIVFRKHKFKDCFPFYSLKNNSVPGLLEGRGFSLFSIVSQGLPDSLAIKIEFLKENQVIRVLDANLENLTVVVWNGRSMSRSTFCSETPFIDFEGSRDNDGPINLELVSTGKSNSFKIKADFFLSHNGSLYLEKITEIGRG